MTSFGTFCAPTRVIAGVGAAVRVPEQLLELGGGAVALVADEGMYRAGLLDELRDQIENTAGLSVATVCLAGVDPTVLSAEEAIEQAKAGAARLVLAVGGGSALSLAKAVAIRLTNPGPIDRYAGAPFATRPAPSVAVPTTAGSGSEVSNALVLYDSAKAKNVGMRGRGAEPDVALLDGGLLVDLPDIPMRDAAADALSHGFEALWARGTTVITDALALGAIRQIRSTLARALRDRDLPDLQRLLEASTAANLACGNTGLGLVHALSSASAVHIPHGRQNSVLLPHVAAFNRPVVSPEARHEIDALADFYSEVGLLPHWADLTLPADADELMIEAALASPFHHNNRRDSTPDQLRALLAPTHVDSSTLSRSSA